MTAPPERPRRTTSPGSPRRRGYLVAAAVVVAVSIVAVIFAAHSTVKVPPVDVKHLAVKGEAPALDAAAWINSAPLTKADLSGKVVLYDFWTYSCINCQRTIPYLRSWYDRYRADGLVIVGIHTPEFDFEHKLKNVQAAVKRLGVTWPVALDNDMKIWNEFANNSWPADYVADKTGHIRDTHVGEGDYDETENVIRQLLGVPAGSPRASLVKHAQTRANQTSNPETYLGLQYQDPTLPLIEIQAGTHDYQLPKGVKIAAPSLTGDGQIALPPGTLEGALIGRWSADQEAVTSDDSAATILLGVHAQVVDLVMATKTGKPIDAVVEIDGQPIPPSERGPSVHEDANGRTVVTVRASDLYYILRSPSVETHRLSVTASAPGLEAYDFTFG